MQLIDSTAITAYLVFAVGVLLLGLVVGLVAVPATLRATRRDRHERSETIPTYYGRLHFAG